MPTFPLPHFDRAARDAEHTQLLARIILDTPNPVHLPTPTLYVDPADARLLRGIPAVGGRGSLGGHINGTRPDTVDYDR